MAPISPVNKVKLIIGMLSAFPDIFTQVEKCLADQFGPIDYTSLVFPFNFTTYYNEEMGSGIKRKFLSFQKLIDPGRLSSIKVWTNQLETKFATTFKNLQVKRPINLDPGYLTSSKLILATTKDYSHRIYLSKGIYAEVTLYYQKGKYQPWPWTYPDYQTTEYLAFFEKIRKIYLSQLKSIKRPESKEINQPPPDIPNNAF